MAVGSSERGGARPHAPRLTAEPTSRVTVACPTNLVISTSGRCMAFGFDSSGKFSISTVTSWTSSNTSVATVSGSTISAVAAGTATISATVGGVRGSTSVTVVPASGGTLTVSISGPTEIRPNLYCSFFAAASGGTGTYTYSWTHSADAGIAFENELTAKSYSTFSMTVNVSDSNGATGSATRSVFVRRDAPLCQV